MSTNPDQSAKLLALAKEDLAVARLIDREGLSPVALGFHAQQAAKSPTSPRPAVCLRVFATSQVMANMLDSPGHFPSAGLGDVTIKSMKPQVSKARPTKDESRGGFPDDAKHFRARVRAAIAANRETLRRLAK